MAIETVFYKLSLVFGSTGSLFFISTLLTTRLLLENTYSFLILLVDGSTPKIVFLIIYALPLWKVSKSTAATADLIFDAIKLHMSPIKS